MSLYVPLWCKSNFSFLEGASHPDELVDEAYRLGLPALALTDRDGMYGVVRAHVKAREVGLKLIIGSQVTVAGGSTIVLLAEDRSGYANLCQLITKGRLRSEKGESAVGWDEICAHAAGLVALWGGGQSVTGHTGIVELRGVPTKRKSVMPAKAGIQANGDAGEKQNLDSRVRGNDGEERKNGLAVDATKLDRIAGDLRDAFGDRLYSV
ncbi:MAG: PHP domain-containing protein, partial [Candidatus Binatia bacterium]